jgi:sterol desaturase/sphingolipid hydroxylase (fatty acid hydroxylase superfamily)
MNSLLKTVWEGEMPTPSEKWRLWIQVLIAVFAVGFVFTTILDALFNADIMLGPGLVDTGIPAVEWARIRLEPILDRGDLSSTIFLSLFLPMVVICLLWNAIVVYRGFTLYPKNRGKPYPLRKFFTFFLLNAVDVFLLYGMLMLCGAIAWLWFGKFHSGFDIVRAMTIFSKSIVDRVPTLVVLPYPLPLFASMIVVDFFYYWFHRWGHTNRLWWLLWHRPHHMTDELVIPCTQPVFAAAPLFLLIAVPFQIGVGVLAKLFGHDTMVLESLILGVISATFAIYAHTSAYYEWFGKQKILMFLASFNGNGNYHYMHHSAIPGHEVINVSGGCFYFWDRVFGTYVKPTKEIPPVGLTGSPELYMNPLRLGLSGMAQIAYELKHNKAFKTRLKILFGSSEYFPPVSKDFAKKKGTKKL